MEDKILKKLYKNEIVKGIKGEPLDYLELAKVIKDYMHRMREAGHTIKDIEQDLGVQNSVLYKYMALLKIPESDLRELAKMVSYDKLARILFRTKTLQEARIVIKRTQTQGMNINQIETYVAELHNPTKVSSHFITVLSRFQLAVEQFKKKPYKSTKEQSKRIKSMIGEVVMALDEIKRMV